MPRWDSHHISHNRLEWSLRPESQFIREHPGMMVQMPRPLHVELHTQCPPVPMLGFHALQNTLKLWTPDSADNLKTLDSLCSSIDIAAQHERSHPIEREAAFLTIEALELQRPFIKEALAERIFV